MDVLQGLARSHIVSHHQPKFMYAAVPLNGIEKYPVKIDNLFLTRCQAFLNGHFPEGVHDGGNLDLFRTPRGARLT